MKTIELTLKIECKDSTDVGDISFDLQDTLLCDNVKHCTIEYKSNGTLEKYESENPDFEEQELLVRNKWNGKTYKVLETTDKIVKLQREDGTQFTIQKSEYFFNYSEKRVDKVN